MLLKWSKKSHILTCTLFSCACLSFSNNWGGLWWALLTLHRWSMHATALTWATDKGLLPLFLWHLSFFTLWEIHSWILNVIVFLQRSFQCTGWTTLDEMISTNLHQRRWRTDWSDRIVSTAPLLSTRTWAATICTTATARSMEMEEEVEEGEAVLELKKQPGELGVALGLVNPTYQVRTSALLNQD